MGDTANGSWSSRELGAYLRREEARAMDSHEQVEQAKGASAHGGWRWRRAADVLAGIALLCVSGLISVGLILWAIWWAIGRLMGGV